MVPEKKILVIDDNDSNLLLIKSILTVSHPEYIILLATSGKQGIEIAKLELPEAILLDIFMPAMDGYETCQKIKSDESTSSIPILMISAGAQSPEVRLEGLHAGADAIVSKPFKKEEFIALVNVMLRIKKAEDKLKKQNRELEIYIRKQINEFQHTEERFLQISGYALEFFWEVNPEGMVTYISPVVEKILGYKPDEIVDKMYFFPFKSERNTSPFIKLMKGNFESDKYFKDERLIFRHLNGEKVWMSASGFPLKDGNDELIGYRGVCQDITDRVKTEIDLQHSLLKINEYQTKLKKMNSELSITEERERRRIAEYLHDGISQNLSLVYIKLTALLNSEQLPKTSKTIVESVDLINNAIIETRSLTYDLSPPILYELGLIPAIKWKLDQVENKYGINTTIKSNTDSLDIITDIRILLYRIISELIANVIKHANADLLIIDVFREQNKLYISVIDNGQGFDTNKHTKFTDYGGFGLFSIKERLDSIQGSLSFESENNSGTKAIVQIPM
jgi:PAS domain S-box-containing protein